MVDYSHLSAGNSDSSPSRDLFADFGVSPISPKMVVAELALVEYDPTPLNVSISSDECSNSKMNGNLEPGLSTEVLEIFRAARHLSKQDRLDVVEERKKNQTLMDFFAAHGFSTNQLNDFASKGKVLRKVDEFNMFEKSSQREFEKTYGMVSGDDSSKNDRDNEATINSTFEIGCSSLRPPKNGEIPTGSKRDGDVNIVHTNGAPISSGPPPIITKSWSSIVANDEKKSCIQLEYFPPPPAATTNGPIIIRPLTEVLKEGNKLWNSCLVGGFLKA